MSEELVLKVDPAMRGTRIDRLLAEHYPTVTRSRFQKLLRDGWVTARGKKVRSAYRVLEGDEIRVVFPPPEPSDLQPEEIPLHIVHEDDVLLVVDKPAGMVVHPAAGNRHGTLVQALLHHCPGLEGGEPLRPGIVHRLDKDTSGLLVVAKNSATHVRLASMMQERRIRREYVALVWGSVGGKGRIEAAIGRHPVDRKRMSVKSRRGKKAVTHYEVREKLPFTTLLDVRLETGRTHQIRVHLASRGHPVFGDTSYGGGNSRLTRLPAGFRVQAGRALKCMPRQALHAACLSFPHPETGDELRFDSPLPDDFSSILALLRRPTPGVPG